MNLHIFNDGLGYFLNETVERIERLEQGNNLYINLFTGCKHQNDQTTYLDFDPKETIRHILAIENVTRVYFHAYNFNSSLILEALHRKDARLIFIWVFWSGEFYNLPEFIPALYQPYARQHFYTAPHGGFRKLASVVKSMILRRPVYRHKALIESYKKIKYFASFLPLDYERVKAYSKAPLQYVPFSYVSYEQLIDASLIHEHRTGSEIMINHSADPTLNHYEILTFLSGKKFDNNIFLPLAYGNKEYAAQIASAALHLFGNQVNIQQDFIPKTAYSKRLIDLGYAIFNIKIQQGLGNILVLLWLGVKVFLDEESTVYQNFRMWGMHVFSIQQDLPGETFSQSLTPEQTRENRDRIRERFSDETVDNYFRQMLLVP